MTTAVREKTEVEPLHLRTTYFIQNGGAIELGYVTLASAAAAVTQMADLFVAADRLRHPDSSTGVRQAWQTALPARPYVQSIEVVSIDMRSPLAIAVAFPWFALKAGGFVGAVLMLAERICTFGPRVSRKRKEELLRAAAFDNALKSFERRERADVIALELIKDGLGHRPDHMDFLDPADPDDDDLEPVEIDP
jgi:hypothetical protein